MNPDSPAVGANGGGLRDRGARGPRGGRSRRAKNRRYGHSCRVRSRLTIVSWNAEGIRTKLQELGRWLSDEKVDVMVVQEAQLAGGAVSVPGYQVAAVSRRARGRRDGGPVKGGDVLILIRNGIDFVSEKQSPIRPDDDTTEWCAVRVFARAHQSSSKPPSLNIFNMYRPPIWTNESDDRTDRFDPAAFPTSDNTLILGDFNAHHPSWDVSCLDPDEVGKKIQDWMRVSDWEALNSGAPTRAGYGEGSRLTAPDVAMAHRDLARRCTWAVGEDLGSDHLPMVITTTVNGGLPRRTRKSRWAFHKANWPAFMEDCEQEMAHIPAQDLGVEALSKRITEVIGDASRRWIPRGARVDPKPWAMDPDLEDTVRARREAREELQRTPSEETRRKWKDAKRRAAEAEAAAQQRSFRDLATNELNKPAAIGRVSKILKKMEGAVQSACPGQAVNGDRGQLAVEDRTKAEAFITCYANVSKNVRLRHRDRTIKAEIKEARARGCCCKGQKTQACQPFSRHEMTVQIKNLHLRKAPGPDEICTEHLVHQGPVAQEAVLVLINKSWESAVVPSSWRRATIIPIPKAGKDPGAVDNYRPISLTSHLAKLVERMIAARLTYLADLKKVIPPEQVGFRRGRAADESLARLIQSVQDGWNRPKPRGRPVDGSTADKFVLLAFDFSRAYDTVDHRMLFAKLTRHLPLCMARWVYGFLRDRRARAEVNGVRSSERPFRAGLPQGSVLSPTLFTIWAADLIEELRAVPRTQVFAYADDTATLSAGATIELAKSRAQRAADTLAGWARRWKMRIAGQKTQALVLSQWSRDAVDFKLRVDGAEVRGGPHLKLLGITFDRLLHFGEHCTRLRRKVKPRIAHLRTMTNRTWGLREQQLRTVANGYVRGALEHAASAWLPATPPGHVEQLDRELRAAARVITGCPRSTPVAPLMAEAGLPVAQVRRGTLAARMLCRARALPADDPLRIIAEDDPPRRLTSTTGWRRLGREALLGCDIEDVTIEERLEVLLPPWSSRDHITVSLDMGPGARRDAGDSKRRETAEAHLSTLPTEATWIWSDGSAEEGTSNGGGGALLILRDGERREIRVAAGRLCSSTRAELYAIRAALEEASSLSGDLAEGPIVLCTDSQAALTLLDAGPGAQTTPLGADIWRLLCRLTSRGQEVTWQWVPSHCGIQDNETADVLAREAAGLPQEAPVDVRTITCAVARTAARAWRRTWPDSLFRRIWGDRQPGPVPGEDREAAVDVHQLRAGHWGLSRQYLHRIGRLPGPACTGCADKECPAARCVVCREEADTPEHVLLRCPCLAGLRLRLLGNIFVDPTRLRDGGVVAALARGFRRHLEPLADGRHAAARED